ncbi:hypothetical protein QFZ77_006330 [Paenibacillus sp. V4I3]|uniref:hypothetical protein n=1 Tax=unclassified Paenibacillus TaxID=185978 RepID=UPI00278B3A0B|nr:MULTISPECIES: hypothetical protein [unclassified Paenibacillus]MDQ0877671.1 hypothetical protein [Paenibacillus sp. V4I3]MDQ0886453.1 hypothetical protein [Paenibacillus sp. V4I9]
MRIVVFILLLMCFITTGCTKDEILITSEQTKTIGNPTAQEVLRMDPNANVFMCKDTIYNAGIPWVDELKLTKDIQVTEITHQSNNGKAFKNGTANKLAVGTKIFRVKERNDILIAETERGDIRFYQLVEG